MNYTAVRTGYKTGLYVSQTPVAMAINTIFQMRGARYVMPLIDHPALKATLNLCLTHPTAFGVLGNAAVQSTMEIEDEATMMKTCFYPTPPLPTYVMSFSLMQNYSTLTSGEMSDSPTTNVHYLMDIEKKDVEWIAEEATGGNF